MISYPVACCSDLSYEVSGNLRFAGYGELSKSVASDYGLRGLQSDDIANLGIRGSQRALCEFQRAFGSPNYLR